MSTLDSEVWKAGPSRSLSAISLEHASSFLMQVAQEGYGGKRSCALTSQLNAHIALGLDPDEALRVQTELVDDPKFDTYWSPPICGPNAEWRSWQWPYLLAILMKDEFDIDVAGTVGTRSGCHLMTEIEEQLQYGNPVILLGMSKVALHARLAFQPQEIPSKIFVHDPHYPETTGLYEYSELPLLQTSSRALITPRN